MSFILNKLLILFSFGLQSICTATDASIECQAPTSGAPWHITRDCVDPVYNNPYIIEQSDFEVPITHRRLRARFNGTDERFNIYLPPRSVWKDENASEETISFGADSGAYTVQTSGTRGYRADAAAAKFARRFAQTYYNYTQQIYGYFYGGSGGSYQVVGGIENTFGVWDGAVPIVQAVPISIPLNHAVRSLAALVLRPKAALLADAVRPGGRSPYDILDWTEGIIFREATRQGITPRAWENFTYTSNTFLLTLFRSAIQAVDPSYAEDFWSKQGYLGTDCSALGDILRAAKIDLSTTIQRVTKHASNATISLTLDALPNVTSTSGLEFSLYTTNGSRVGHVHGTLDFSNNALAIENRTDPEVAAALERGLILRIDNRWVLALHAYYRHQVPNRSGFYGFDQLRYCNNCPVYPQRNVEFAPVIAAESSGGGIHTGRINGKIIVVSNLLDVDAFPWHADWYKVQVQAALGDRFDDNYRLWYNDNADHNFGPVIGARASRLVEFTGIYQQALRDLGNWVENGKAPPCTSGYAVSDSQIVLAGTAAERRGVQPLVELTVDGQKIAHVDRGQAVQLSVSVEIPPDAGELDSIEWDFLGTGDFEKGSVNSNCSGLPAERFSYSSPGTYFPVVRVTTKCVLESPFGRIMNLGRARVIVASGLVEQT